MQTLECEIKNLFSSFKKDFKGPIRVSETFTIFVKYSLNPRPDFYTAELKSYELLKLAIPDYIPEIYYCDSNGIAIEYINTVDTKITEHTMLADVLAKLHSYKLDSFGAEHKGYIGNLPMSNAHKDTYVEFFKEYRVEPYLKQAFDASLISPKLAKMIDTAILKFESIQQPNLKPCLVHGDLWNGNIIFSNRPYLIDPAAHGACRELDLAMLSLFGFPNLNEIFSRYQSLYPLENGYQQRMLINQIFYLLVHVVLFGSSYVSTLESTVKSILKTD